MKILYVGDVHIRNYAVYNEFDKNGISNRLKLFNYLADDSIGYAKKQKVSCIILSGDICDSSRMSSAELLVARHFLEKLSSVSSIEVVLIHGNHDVNLKSDSLVEHNSILSSIVPHRKNIQYVDTEQVVTAKGLTIHCCPWTLCSSQCLNPRWPLGFHINFGLSVIHTWLSATRNWIWISDFLRLLRPCACYRLNPALTY
mgnify:CR=1 FL=1